MCNAALSPDRQRLIAEMVPSLASFDVQCSRVDSGVDTGANMVSSLASFDVQCSLRDALGYPIEDKESHRLHRSMCNAAPGRKQHGVRGCRCLIACIVRCAMQRRAVPLGHPPLPRLIACIVRCAMQRPAPQVERIAAVKRPSASVPRRPAAGPFSRCALGGRKCLESLGFERPLSFTCHVAARRFRLRRSLLNHYTDLLGLLFHLFQKIKPRQ